MSKRLYRSVGCVAGVVSLVGFVLYAIKVLRDYDISPFTSLSSVLGITIVAIVYSSIIPISAMVWRKMLADVGVNKSWCVLVTIMAITQIGKYLPGNVGQHIGRAAMSISYKIGIKPFTITVAMESMLAVFAALLVGIVTAILSDTELGVAIRGSGVAYGIVALSCCFIMIALMSSERWLPFILGKISKNNKEIKLPSPKTIILAVIAYSINYILIGISLVILARLLLIDVPVHDGMLLTCSFALAWVSGFFTPGAPAGLGVREVIMLGLISSSYSEPNAILLIIGLRLATILSDGLSFAIGNVMLLCPSLQNIKHKQH